jgi:chloramphenicol 3-O phosphotransferase
MARGGAPVILDEVFLSGGSAQASLGFALQGVGVLWVGVRCDPVVAAAREARRIDRVPGMADKQAHGVHAGMGYDVEVDTTRTPADACARVIAGYVIA